MFEQRPPLYRRLDILYFVFFLIHIPVMLLIDLVPFYPSALVPAVSQSIRKFYIETYRDRFFIAPPNWFRVYIGLEGVYHLPVTIWMLRALPNNDPMLPLQLLIFALETSLTTLTCLVEMLSWEGYTSEEVTRLTMLYGPYLGFVGRSFSLNCVLAMSRYREGAAYSSADLAYRDAPPQRWDSDRFARERDYRRPPVPEPAYEYRAPPHRPAAAAYDRERYFEDDRYGPRGVHSDRRYYDEEDFYREDPRASGGVLVPFRPERPEPPVRPGHLIRRQSSLDTFDRRPATRYENFYDYRPQPLRAPRRAEGYYDEVRIQDPEYYGDDGFREFREREWVRRRRRSTSRSRSRTRSRSRARSRSRERHSDFVEEIREEKVEKPYPRKGKTRMPKRLVHTKALFDLGYPFYEEDEKTILIEKALGPENIDEVFARSKEYREREASTTTTRLIESYTEERAPPPPVEVAREEKIVEKTEVKTIPISEAARSVQEWDALTVRSGSPKSHRSHRSHSRRRSRRGSSVSRETIVKKTVIEKEVSPAPTHRTRRRSHSRDSETVIEKTKIISDEEVGESNSVHVGPLALVVDRRPSRSDREIKEEIRRLEAERRAIRRERRHGRDEDVVKIERIRERTPSPRGEVIIEHRGDEILEVRKDRRARARSAAPSPRIIKAMMATLT
ncbi:hypothetical protein DV738_g112, partial [Chaetothyriales sp. CBS 135597]